MLTRISPKPLVGAAVAVLVLTAGILLSSRQGQAKNDNNGSQDEKLMIQTGLEFASDAGIQLDMTDKDPNMVGLGSYIVNVSGDCNGCHTANPATEYTATGNPYLLHPVYNGTKQINAETYLGGGSSFGMFGDVEIISRNLTPDAAGRPEGHTLAEFKQILTTGIDMDHAHPSCSATITTNCMPFPFNGDLLQVMPWPNLQNLTDRQITAVYTFLTAIPCLQGYDPDEPGRCGGN